MPRQVRSSSVPAAPNSQVSGASRVATASSSEGSQHEPEEEPLSQLSRLASEESARARPARGSLRSRTLRLPVRHRPRALLQGLFDVVHHGPVYVVWRLGDTL
eukprot:189157-Amphidinium_carterae.2